MDTHPLRKMCMFFFCSGAIWNTMIGTSLLAMPWAMELSGYILGPLVSCVVGFFASFTATRILIVNAGGMKLVFKKKSRIYESYFEGYRTSHRLVTLAS